jgi:DNA-binding transcriptional ArsR family regulator
MDLEKTASRLEALGNPTRLGIYRLLVRAGQDGLPVGEIQQRTEVARSTLSHHLHRLIAGERVRTIWGRSATVRSARIVTSKPGIRSR